MVFEEDAIASARISKMLTGEGANSVLITTLDEAWALVERRGDEIDGAVIDLRISGGSGLEVALAFDERRRRPIPWVALSNSESRMRRVASHRAGALAFLVKPAGVGEIVEVLASAFDRAVADALPCASQLPDRRMLEAACARYGICGRDVDIVRGLLREESNETIADALRISVPMLSHTLRRIRKRTVTTTRGGIVRVISDACSSIESVQARP